MTSTLTLILGLIVGAALGVFGFKIYLKRQFNKKLDESRKGLFTDGYTVGDDKKAVTIRAEVKVIKETKSKVLIDLVDVTEISVSGGVGRGFTSEADKVEWAEMIRGWYNVTDAKLEWFEDTPQVHRENALKDLLE